MIKPILLVEDDENDVFFFKRAMKDVGSMGPLRVASDGQAAIDYLSGAGKFADRAEFPLPSIVLLDLKLPLVMGLDVLAWIRQQRELSLVVVILSSSREESDIATAYRLGANGYLVKSPDLAKLRDIVRAITDFWLTHNVLTKNSDADGGATKRPHFPQRIPSPLYPSALPPMYENNCAPHRYCAAGNPND